MLDEGLPVLGCVDCDGVLISLLSYRDWAERTINNESVVVDKLDIHMVSANNSRRVLNCPKCTRLMTKYLIDDGSKNRLDLCDHCDEAWLDGGEWELLKRLQLSKKLPRIFTDTWQLKVQHDISEEQLFNRYVELLGTEDTEKAATVRAWLNSHKKRAELLFFISQK